MKVALEPVQRASGDSSNSQQQVHHGTSNLLETFGDSNQLQIRGAKNQPETPGVSNQPETVGVKVITDKTMDKPINKQVNRPAATPGHRSWDRTLVVLVQTMDYPWVKNAKIT